MRPHDTRKQLREEMQTAMAHFLASGGTIEAISPGFSGETFSFNNKKKERQEHSRRAAQKRFKK